MLTRLHPRLSKTKINGPRKSQSLDFVDCFLKGSDFSRELPCETGVFGVHGM